MQQLGRDGVLVNNAGKGQSTPVLDLDPVTWNEVLATDLTAPLLNAQVVARHMVRQGRGGRIINITSVHEHLPRHGAAAHCAAKAEARAERPPSVFRWGASPRR